MAVLTGGQRAYAEYFGKLRGLNSNGEALPMWDELPADRRAWWEAAAITPPGALPFWKTKVFWFNVIVLMLAAVESQQEVLKGLLPANWFAWVVFGLPVVNAFVRGVQQFKAKALATQNTQESPIA